MNNDPWPIFMAATSPFGRSIKVQCDNAPQTPIKDIQKIAEMMDDGVSSAPITAPINIKDIKEKCKAMLESMPKSDLKSEPWQQPKSELQKLLDAGYKIVGAKDDTNETSAQ